MTPKELVLDFYKNDLLLNQSEVKEFLHPELIIEWNSSKGFVQMDYDDVMRLTSDLSKAYVRSKMRITHIVAEGQMVSLRYSHFVNAVTSMPSKDLTTFMSRLDELDGNFDSTTNC